jgi:hypothetical protein
MKTLFLLIFIALFSTATAQTKLYDPKELKEDADYYFSTLFWVHPNPYYFCSYYKFNKLKKSIYKELKKPLSKADFILAMAQVNSCLDMHSTIPLDDAIAEMLSDKMREITFSFLRDSIDTISFQDSTIDSLNEFLKERNINKGSITNSIFVLPLVEIRENRAHAQ